MIMKSFNFVGMRNISLFRTTRMIFHPLRMLVVTIPMNILLFECESKAKYDYFSYLTFHIQSNPNHLSNIKACIILVRAFGV